MVMANTHYRLKAGWPKNILNSILLLFSGAVGTAAVQIARALGAIVVGTAGTKDGMDVVTR